VNKLIARIAESSTTKPLRRLVACPKCGILVTPDLVKRVDFERIDAPKCGESFNRQNGAS
jgi:hypothetical protein